MDDTTQNQSIPPAPPPVVPAPQAQPPAHQQPVTAGHPEQGPVRIEVADEEPTSDAAVESEEVVMQHSQPEVVVAPELQEAGVEQGEDAKEQQLSAEVALAGVSVTNAQAPFVAIPSNDTSLPMTYEQAVVEEKTVKSPKNSLSWFLREIVREWKKRIPIT